MADTITSNVNLVKPEINGSVDTWGDKLNGNADKIDQLFSSGPALKLVNGGTGATTADQARVNLGLGSLATQNGLFSGISSGVNTGDQAVFNTIQVAGQSTLMADSTADVLTLAAGSGVSITTDATTDKVTIALAGGSTSGFGKVAVSGQATVEADAPGGTLNLTAGTGIELSTNATTDTVVISAAGLPTGSVMPYAGNSAPSGWLMCGGQLVSRATYSGLFAIVGTMYGTGDGSTTFALPDLRGRVVAGRDAMGGNGSANRLTDKPGGLNGDVLGAVGGSEVHTLTTAEMAKHQHFIANTESGTAYGLTEKQTMRKTVETSGENDYTLSGSATAATIGLSSEVGADTAHNNVQPTIILNYIIKV